MLAVILLFYLNKDYYTNRDEIKLENNVLITADHLENVEGYTKIYSDKEKDIAYYIRDAPVYSKIEAQKVIIKGLEDCKIIDSYEGGFIVETDKQFLISSGMSGERVLTVNGQEIGFVSSLQEDGKIDCKNLE